jgi:hypothetical protein
MVIQYLHFWQMQCPGSSTCLSTSEASSISSSECSCSMTKYIKKMLKLSIKNIIKRTSLQYKTVENKFGAPAPRLVQLVNCTYHSPYLPLFSPFAFTVYYPFFFVCPTSLFDSCSVLLGGGGIPRILYTVIVYIFYNILAWRPFNIACICTWSSPDGVISPWVIFKRYL